MVAFNLSALPGTDLAFAADVISGETNACRTIPRLPARGLGFDPVGYCCALLPELPITTGPRSWQLSARPQLVSRRLWDHSSRDFDVLEQHWGTAGGYGLQLAVLGPWSLAAEIELANGHRAVTDAGALRDIAEIYSHRMALTLSHLSTRFNAQPRIMITEPQVAALIAGNIPGTSDFDPIAAINEQKIGQLLHQVLAQIRQTASAEIYLASGQKQPPIEALKIAAADGLVINLGAITGSSMLDACGEALAEGSRLCLGCVRLGDDRTTAPTIATAILKLIQELGLEREVLTQQVDITASQELYPGTLLTAAHALGCATKVQELLLQ